MHTASLLVLVTCNPFRLRALAPKLAEAQIEAILAALAFFGTEVPIFYRLRPNLTDEGDNRVFECAAHFGARQIVTHNVKDFLRPELAGYGIESIVPENFLKELGKKL